MCYFLSFELFLVVPGGVAFFVLSVSRFEDILSAVISRVFGLVLIDVGAVRIFCG